MPVDWERTVRRTGRPSLSGMCGGFAVRDALVRSRTRWSSGVGRRRYERRGATRATALARKRGPARQRQGAARPSAPNPRPGGSVSLEGQRRCARWGDEYQRSVPEAGRSVADAVEASWHPLQVPPGHRQYGHTATRAARAVEEEGRRPQGRPPLGDEARGVQLVCAVVSRVSARWGKKQYSECEPHHRWAMRQAGALDQALAPPARVRRVAQPRRSAASAR
jgi:hypothetical protein